MSGFFVLGVPRQKLDELVTRRVIAMEDRLKRPPKPGSTEQRRKKVLSKIESAPPREVLSHEYSVPQFCDDFVRLINKQDYSYLAIGSREGRRWEIHQEYPEPT